MIDTLKQLIPKQDLQIRVGDLLVAVPASVDEHFNATVVLIVRCRGQEVVGLILNKEMPLKIDQLLDGFGKLPYDVRYGGPVSPDKIRLVCKIPFGEPLPCPLGEGLYYCTELDDFRLLLKGNVLMDESIRFYLGYCGWTRRQLQNEIKNNYWIKIACPASEYVFNQDGRACYEKIVNRLNIPETLRKAFLCMPDDPQEN